MGIAKKLSLPLRDGKVVQIRPLTEDDKDILQDGMSALSSQSRRFRFLMPLSRMPDELLRKLTEIDQRNHVAWIAIANDGAENRGVGVARFIRIEGQPDVAEFGIVIIDEYQKRGLGTILLTILFQLASNDGIEMLTGYVLTDNNVMCNWLHRLGATTSSICGSIRMNLAVSKALTVLRENGCLTLNRSRFDCGNQAKM